MEQNKIWADLQTENWLKRHFNPDDRDVFGAGAEVASILNSQHSAQKDYMARVLLELLQNVDDAAAEGNLSQGDNEDTNKVAEFILEGNRLIVLNQGKVFNEDSLRSICLGHISTKIQNNKKITTGSKGIGFRGVLNWSNDIRIFSGDFAVQFSREQCLNHIAKLQNNEIFQHAQKIMPNIIDKFPILLLPANTHFPIEWQNGKYNGIYDTCIELILNDDCISFVIKAINNFITQEYYSALFFRALTTVKFTIIEPDGNKIKTEIRTYKNSDKTQIPSIKTVEIFNAITAKEIQKEAFYMFSIGMETIAIPVNWTQWNKKMHNVYCTFPASKEFCPFPVLMNSYDFELPSNRETIQDNPKNANIIKKLENLLVDIVAPYFAKPEFGTQAIEILAYQQTDQTMFLKNIDKLHAQIATKPIIPTLNKGYKCLDIGLKTINQPEYPSVITKTDEDKFVTHQTHSLLSFSPELQQKISPLSDIELYNLINKHSFEWNTTERISVFFFWVEKIANSSNQLMPKLIKNQKNTFYTFNSSEHTHIFFYSGKQIKGMPDWVPFDTILPQDQKEIFAQTKSKNPEPPKEIDRYLTNKYEHIFNYMDKTRIIKEINQYVNGVYGRAVDLVKCVYLNYKDDEKPSSEADVKWQIPTAHQTIHAADRVYFGLDYYDTIGAKICHAAKLNAIASPETFGISDEEKERFCYTVGNFFGIRSNISPIMQKISADKLPQNYYDQIVSELEQKYGTGYINTLYDVECETIPELENILSNAQQDIILEWLNNLSINRTSNINVSFHKKYSGRYSASINVVDLTVYKLRNQPWLNINNRVVAPVNCLLKQDKAKYPSELIDYVPNSTKYANLWSILDIQDNVCHLPQKKFYEFLLNLPGFDSNGEISKQIYRYIAKTPSETLSYLMKNDYCSEKNKFLSEGKVWVKEGRKQKARFCEISENVYFSSKKVLNLDDKPIMDTPLRNGSLKDFAHIFGVKEFKENVQACLDTSTPHSQNAEFHAEFEKFKPYLLALNATQKLDDILPNLEIILAKDIKILNNSDNLPTIFDDYEIVPTKNANKYFIYLHEAQQITPSKIARAIGDICNTISSSGDIKDTVTLLYMSDNDARKQTLQDRGCDISLLSEYKNTRQLFIDTAKKLCPEADIDTLLQQNPIDFGDIGAYKNSNNIIHILNNLNATVMDFENNGFNYINLRDYNKKLLEDHIYKNKDNFKTYLYNKLLHEGIKEQEKFKAQMWNYEHLDDVPNTHDFDPAKLRPIPSTTGLIKYTDEIYKKNYEKLSKNCSDTDVLDEILSNDSDVSLLTFGHIDIIKEKYDKTIVSKGDTFPTNSLNNIAALEIRQHIPQNQPIELSLPQQYTSSKNHARRQYSAYSEKQKQKAGLKAERQAYEALKRDFPDTVEWLSSNAVEAGVLAQGLADDSLGYDMRYQDKNGSVQYVEAKNATHIKDNVYSFIISPNEERFALNHIQNYFIFLVVSDEAIEKITGEMLKRYLTDAEPESKKCFIPVKRTNIFPTDKE